MILFAVCEVLSSFFATGFAPLCLSAIGAVQLWGREPDSFLSRTGSWTVSWTPVANSAFSPSVAICANSLDQLQSCNWARSVFVFIASDDARKPAAWIAISKWVCRTRVLKKPFFCLLSNTETRSWMLGETKNLTAQNATCLTYEGTFSSPSAPWLFWSLINLKHSTF